MIQLFDYLETFIPLSESSKKAIEEICNIVYVAKNAELQSIGQTCKTIYFIELGSARIFYYRNGNDITEYFAFENNLIARAESLFTGRPSKKAIQVLEDSTIIAIDAKKLFKLYDVHPEIERLFRLIFESAYVETIHRMEGFQFHSAKERYLMLLENTDLVKRIPLKHIASYLGITQVSLSRIRSALK